MREENIRALNDQLNREAPDLSDTLENLANRNKSTGASYENDLRSELSSAMNAAIEDIRKKYRRGGSMGSTWSDKICNEYSSAVKALHDPEKRKADAFKDLLNGIE